MKTLCLALFIVAVANALPQAAPADPLQPPVGCKYECRLSYDLEERQVTEQHCHRETRDVCEPRNKTANICTPKTKELCNCRDEKICEPITIHECEYVNGTNKYIYYEEEPREYSVTECDKKWFTQPNGQKVWIDDPTGESCNTFLKTRIIQVEKWREEPYNRTVCKPAIHRRSCTIVQNTPLCKNVTSYNCVREPLDQICTAVTEKVCKDVHKLKTVQVVKRTPFLTCEGQLDGPPQSYSKEEIFNINTRFPESRLCLSNEIPQPEVIEYPEYDA